nr:cohesin domain-containing protein [Clostridium acetobutylicum]
MFMMTASLGISKNHVFADTVKASNSGVQIQFADTNTSTTMNTIAPKFKITNNTGAPLDLTTLKLRYYFTADGTQDENFWCDHAGMLNGYNYQTITSNVVGTFVAMDNATATADHYLEISFSNGAGQLDAGSSLEVQCRVAKNDWSNYDQSNDYSFTSNASDFTDWDKITGYVNGDLVFGNPPVVDPVITPTTATFDTANPTDVNVAMQLNGFTLSGLTDENGTAVDAANYTISGSNLVLSKAYLAKLALGKHSFNFNFAKGTTTISKPLALTVTDTAGITVDPASVVFDKVAPQDENVALKLNGHTLGDVVGPKGNLVKGTDYTVADDGTVTFSKAYLSTLPLGDQTITFKASDDSTKTAAVTVTVKNSNATNVTVGDVTGAKKGDTIKVPVSVSTVKTPIGLIDMEINYDPTELTAKDVVPTDLVKDTDNYSFIVNTSTPGKISITFTDPTLGTYPIGTDGIFAYLEFLVAGEKAGKYDLKVNPTTLILADENDNDIDCNPPKDGSVTVIGTPVVTPSQINVEQGSATDQPVKIDLNGNTLKDVVDQSGKTLVQGTDYTVTDTGITLSQSYLAGLALGQYTLTLDFNGGGASQTITINVVKNETVKLSVGTVSGNPGDTVKVPVTISQVSTPVGLICMDISYDASKFTVKDVLPNTDLVKDTDNYSFIVNTSTPGKISITFTDPTLANYPISVDGILAYLDFIINSNATAGDSALTVDPATLIVADENDKDIKDAASNGKITVTGSAPVVQSSVVNTSSVTYDQNAPQDQAVSITFNGNTVKDVKDASGNTLKAGSDYTATSDGITLSQSYLATLAAGTYTYTIDFSAGNAGTFTVVVKGKTVVGSATTLAVGTVSGKAGDTVKVPVTISKVTTPVGLICAEIDYDASKFTVKDVLPNTDLVKDTDNYSFIVNTSTPGKISITFTDPTLANYPISADGILAYLDFIINSNATAGDSALTVNPSGFIIADENDKDIQDAASNGKITVTGSTPVAENSVVNTSSVTYDQNAPQDQAVSITLNGNTITDVKDASGNTLKAGSDYTVTSDGITLSQSYLATLAAGTYTYTVDFSAGNAGTFTVVVKAKTVVSSATTLAVGTVSGKAGDTVKVPVTISKVTTPVGLICAEIDYDASKFTVKDVLPNTDLVKDTDNYSFIVNTATAGKISITFTDPTLEKFPISADGILAYLDFIINSNATAGDSALTVNPSGFIVADENDKDVDHASTDGKITITGSAPVVVNSSVNTSSVTYDPAAPQDQAVSVTLNGNTITDVKDANASVLKAGSDYTVTSDGITLSQSYLATLAAGTYTYTVDFSAGNAGTFTVVVKGKAVVNKTTLAVGAASGKAGDTVKVPVTISKVTTPVGLICMEIDYDASKFTVKDVLPNTDLVKDTDNYSFIANTTSAGKISITFTDPTLEKFPISADGVIANIDFVVNSGAATGDSDLTVNSSGFIVADESDTDIDHVSTNGKITVE